MRPLEAVGQALTALLRQQERTQDAEVGDVYVGKDIVVVRLKRTKVIEGEATDTTPPGRPVDRMNKGRPPMSGNRANRDR